MNQNPTADRVVIRRVEEEKVTSSGFIIPEMSVDKPDQGIVVSIGPGKQNKKTKVISPLSVAVDDRVLFAAGAGIGVRVNGEELVVLKESDIIAIVDPE